MFNCCASTLTEIIQESNDSFSSGYVDDHAIVNSFNPDNNNIKEKRENDIRKIKTWMEENQLKMNDAKADFIVLGKSHNLRKNNLDNIKIGETNIHKTSKIKFLGIYLDDELNLKGHNQNRTKRPTTISCSSTTSVNIFISAPPKCYCVSWY